MGENTKVQVRQPTQDDALLKYANEIAELLQRAVKLGYSITLGPEQMKMLITVLEEARLTKP